MIKRTTKVDSDYKLKENKTYITCNKIYKMRFFTDTVRLHCATHWCEYDAGL